MTTILTLRSSVLGKASASNRLIDEAIENLRSTSPTIRIIDRDLAATPIPHLDGNATEALRGDPADSDGMRVRALSDELIEEARAADVLLIGAPMYNFGISTVLKSWFDYVLRAGKTFRYTEAGPEGLLTNKRAVVILTRGGIYSEGPTRTMDAQKPHLRTLLSFVGITDIEFVLAEKLAFGPEDREAALNSAKHKIADVMQILPAEAVL